MIAYNFPKRKYSSLPRGGRKGDFHYMFREEWTGMKCTIKVYKNTLTGATKRIDDQFSAFSSLPFPELDIVLYELSHVVKIKMYNI